MPRSVLAALAVTVAALLAGCTASGAGSSSVSATGRTLRIVLSVPPGAASDPVAQDVLDAEQLAFSQHSGDVHAYPLTLRRLSGQKLSDNARTAILDTGAIAYLGESAPGASADTLGITNGRDLLQVSPVDTAQALTQATAAVPASPDRYYESRKTYGQTFARVVPTTAVEARAEVSRAPRLGIKRLYVANDGSPYGVALAASLRSAAGSLPVVLGAPTASGFSASGADGLLFAGRTETQARTLFSAVASAQPGAMLMAPSALANPSFAASLGSAGSRLTFSVPGVSSASLTPAGLAFVSTFTSTYHHAPAAQAIFGYEAMAAVISVIAGAGRSGNDRAAVVRGFLNLRDRASVLGSYSMDKSGDTNLAQAFVFERLRAGRLVPVPG